jgi:hypothetical protein
MNTPTDRPPIKEGLTVHLKRIDGLINELNGEIVALQRIEKALRDCHDRLDRQGGLIIMETQLVEALIKHERPDRAPTPIKAVPTNQLADRVEDDLKNLVSLTEADLNLPQSNPKDNAVAIPIPRR